MEDRIYEAFLEEQFVRGMELAHASDLLELLPVHGALPSIYVARFYSKGLLRAPDGEIVEGNHFEVGIRMPPDYLRRVNPAEILTWLGPPTIFHPNVSPPAVCVGRIVPGTPLVDILYQTFELIGGTKITMNETDALNFAACQWARAHPERFPVERRPLKRRATRVEAQSVSEAP